ncbi:AAA family ATPase [Bombilactobacillus folatiphilus]|uniref:AAA family ATPase n=1 Tax=Bombilactobacillus folatiphilus TaxID=2923362 RepID=A0ABY4P980_9LACO|nr:RNA polymerase recycling motor HelD [Bombilactobacillus folatiphilus]UQS82294.1 AAA family ATPase [Bombilactobacillus folatiphilus]
MNFLNNTQQQEQAHLNHVEQNIAQQLQQTEQKLEQVQQERHRVEINYGANTRANYIETDDIMETYATTQQQKQLLNSSTSDEELLQRKQKNLLNLQTTPYFGRIDIVEDQEADTLYIGTASLDDPQTGNFLVYDWRAPIAAIYYNGTLGQVKYQTPAGPKQVALQRKRQFSIKAGQITNMFDTNETIGDEILQNALGQASSAQMKNIVATIQRKQNQIIRDTKSQVLIVQGAAGSGKTSTIMQRIAYLLYHSRQNLDSDQIILFSPNKLFSNYIAEVLPSLGEKNMRQVTLSEFLTKRLQGFHIETLFERFEHEQQNHCSHQKIRQFKTSKTFIELLRNYQQLLTTPTFRNLYFEGEIIFSAEQIQQIYQSWPKNLLPADKYLQTKNQLIQQVKQLISSQQNADWVVEAVNQFSDAQYQQILQEKKLLDAEVNQQQQALNHYYLQQHYLPLYDAIYNDYLFDETQTYAQFLRKLKPADISQIVWQEMIQQFEEQLERHSLQLDDATAILYLRYLVTGRGQNHQIQHLFIDEIQDYSDLQLAYIHEAFPQAQLTLVGDIEQNVYQADGLPTEHFQEIATLLGAAKTAVITLNQSYRSTAAITNFAKQLIASGDQIQPFNRQGQKPQIILTPHLQETVEQQAKINLAHQITVAIITKTQAQAQKLDDQFTLTHHLLTEKALQIPQGIIILPVYLAKGLEFDSVIAYDVSPDNYQTLGDQGILYTIATRAMHQLTLIAPLQPSTLLQKLDPTTFTLAQS